MTAIQPELWVEQAARAVEFYAAGPELNRFSPRAIGGTTSRTLLVVEEPAAVLQQAVAAGASETAAVADEHGWRIGRIVDPFGHEWEIGRPLGAWPPPPA